MMGDMETLNMTSLASRSLTPTEIEGFREQGFLVKEGLISADEIGQLTADLVKLARGGYPSEKLIPVPDSITDAEALERILCIHQPHALSPVIHGFTVHAKIAAVLSGIVGAHLAEGMWDGSVKCMQSMFFAKAPGMPGQAWHQDEIYIPTRDRSLCGAWIAVDDATIDNGCLWVLPGSHRAGVLYDQRPIEDLEEFDFAAESFGFDDSGEVPVEVPAGSVVFFNGYLLHRSRRNRSQRYRRALVSHYMTAQSRLPWRHITEADGSAVSVAMCDRRNVHMVCGIDPMAHKGYQLPQDAHLRQYAGRDEAEAALAAKVSTR